MGFDRAFEDKIRTLNYKYDGANSFPDAPLPSDVDGKLNLTGLGLDEEIFGRTAARCAVAALRRGWGPLENTCRAKTQDLQNLYRDSRSNSHEISPGAIMLLK